MTDTCTVIIGAAELLPALKERVQSSGDILTFGDDETAQALETISARRPTVVALERVFAATSRGAALIVRLRSDPALADSEIRVMSHDSDYVRVRRKSATPAPAAKPQASTAAVAAPPNPLDYRGTRRVPRFVIPGAVEVRLDGNQATLVDLSTMGAQVVSTTILRPNQRVRMTLPDSASVRINGIVAWAAFELPRGNSSPQYRAGLEFHGANADALQAFIDTHKGTPAKG
jgi:hypothetical protein